MEEETIASTENKETLVSPELNAKMKKNLLWIFIFAAIMIFAGLTSGYLVSRGGKFWVNVAMPPAFLASTILMFTSSFFLIAARWAVKRGKTPLMKVFLGIALVTGCIFGYTQIKGGYQLVETGNALSGPIINIKGMYGKYYTFYYDGKEVSYENNQFYLKGEPLNDAILDKMKSLSEGLMEGARTKTKTYKLANYGSELLLRYNNKLVTYANNQLQIEGIRLSQTQHSRLYYFAQNIVENKGDFIMRGTYGEDFVVYYQGTPLEYSNRTFYLNGQLLSPKKLNDLYTQDNTASSYIYAFSFMHFLHWIGGAIALLVMFIRGLREKYTSGNYLGITLGSIYWHFLGILWLYLYVFLIFIH